MKFLSLVFIFVFISIPLWADGKETRLLNQLRERVEVTIKNRSDFSTLAAGGFEIDYCTRPKNNRIFVYATPYETERLKDLGFTTTPSPVEIGEDSRDSAYHTYTTLTQELQQLAKDHSSIARLESIGK